MLVEFRLKNYRSFRDEQRFSMLASADKRLLENTVATKALGKEKLLRSAVIFGSNASGKSNFIAALGFVQRFVRWSASREPIRVPIQVRPFAFDEASVEAPTEFEVSFLHNNVRYQYGFALDRKRIHEEWLLAYPKGQPQTWFERKWDRASDVTEWYYGPKLTGEKRKLEQVTRDDVLFLSVAATFSHEQLSEVYDWFARYLSVVDATSTGRWADRTAKLSEQDPQFHGLVRDLIADADLGIQDFRVEEREVDLPESTPENLRPLLARRIDIYMLHDAGMCEDGSPRLLPLSHNEESFGTQRLFALATPILRTLTRGGILAIDELDASLHPLLVRRLVEMFHDPGINERGAQLIFNTHDTTLLDTSLLRRDQIWFTEKDRSGASHLYPLLDYSPRHDEALARGYLRGRYGAIPFFGAWPEGLKFDDQEATKPTFQAQP